MKTQGGVRLNQENKVEVNHAAALKWVLNDENICTTIPGITTFDQMDLDFSVMGNLALSPEERRDLEISAMLPGPLFCQNCRQCIPSCPRKVHIPSLMRAFMYKEGYGNLCQAQMTVADLPPHRGLRRLHQLSDLHRHLPQRHRHSRPPPFPHDHEHVRHTRGIAICKS